jgi:predicted  nucleic acid-binding Zn-ribbon protein
MIENLCNIAAFMATFVMIYRMQDEIAMLKSRINDHEDRLDKAEKKVDVVHTHKERRFLHNNREE